MNSYTKLRDGSWGVRTEGAAKVGQTLTVTKKDGGTKAETVGRVLWTGPDSRTGKIVSLCSILKDSAPASPRTMASSRTPRRNWRPCGYPGCNPGYCDECDGQGMYAAY